MDWLLAPIDPTRAHDVGLAISWHARLMVLSWGVLAPLAVIAARFFKIMPRQNYPAELDNQTWWRSHWIGQSLVVALSLVGLALVFPLNLASPSAHNLLGAAVLLLMLVQAALGLFRGSKGGPTARAADGTLRGDHYDMTPWRRMFETLHKSLGYGLLCGGIGAIVLGLWKANAPVWMWAALLLWWAGLSGVFVALQRRGMAVDTYQAIWGADPRHPGNSGPAPGWGVHRPSETNKGEPDVRSDRGDGLRSH